MSKKRKSSKNRWRRVEQRRIRKAGGYFGGRVEVFASKLWKGKGASKMTLSRYLRLLHGHSVDIESCFPIGYTDTDELGKLKTQKVVENGRFVGPKLYSIIDK